MSPQFARDPSSLDTNHHTRITKENAVIIGRSMLDAAAISMSRAADAREAQKQAQLDRMAPDAITSVPSIS